MKSNNLFSVLLLALIINASTFFIVIAQENKNNPAMTELWTPLPEKVFAKGTENIPSDAIILFDGQNLDAWEDTNGGEARWPINDGIATVAADSGSIKTKQPFGDCQLHVEWRIAPDITGEDQFRGNSGIVIQGKYEIQVLESFEYQTYVNGQAGAVYKQHPPMVNACKKPGEWQTYDIIFTAPRFTEKGTAIIPAKVTVLHNGVVIQNNSEILGAVKFTGLPQYKPHNLKEPLVIQNHLNHHNNPVQYRKIWIREL